MNKVRTKQVQGWRLEELAFLTLTVVLSSEHRAGRRWQLRCPSLGLGHGRSHPAEPWTVSSPSPLYVTSSASIRDPPSLGVGTEA